MSQANPSPKKPQSAYFIYAKENRDDLKAKFPLFSAQDITKELSKGFKQLTTDDRKIWDDKAQQQKEDYQRELEATGQDKKGSVRKSRSKTDPADETHKIKQSPLETRAMSHDRENPHRTRSHGKVEIETEKTTTQTQKTARRGSASSTPRSGKKKKPQNDIEEEQAQPETTTVPTLETEKAVATNSPLRVDEDAEKDTQPRDARESGEAQRDQPTEQLIPDTNAETDQMLADDKEINSSEEIQVPRRDPLHLFPDTQHHAHHVHTHPQGNQMTSTTKDDMMEPELEKEEDTENFNPNLVQDTHFGDMDKGRKVKVLDTNRRTEEAGKKGFEPQEQRYDQTASTAP